jgi:hypothetical protein
LEKSLSNCTSPTAQMARKRGSPRRTSLLRTSREQQSIEIPVSRRQLPEPYFSVMPSAKLMTQIVRKFLCGPTAMPATR